MVRRTGNRDQGGDQPLQTMPPAAPPKALSKDSSCSVTVVPAVLRFGIRKAELRLRQSVSRQTVRLGHAKLVLEGSTGHFIFWRAGLLRDQIGF
jgi:hypothetical protein